MTFWGLMSASPPEVVTLGPPLVSSVHRLSVSPHSCQASCYQFFGLSTMFEKNLRANLNSSFTYLSISWSQGL